MKQHRRVAAAALLVMSTVPLQGCTREERSLNVHALLTIERVPGGVSALEMEGRLHDTQLSADGFDETWTAITRGTATGAGLAVSLGSVHLGGGDTNLLAGLTLVLPTPLRTGTRIPVGNVLPAPREMPLYWSTWGRRTLRAAGTAEIALRTFDYRAVGMVIENEFIAETVAGTIDVTGTGGDQVALRLDITALNSAGNSVRLQGEMTITAERYRPPIT